MKKFLMIFLLIVVAGFLRGSPSVSQDYNENSGKAVASVTDANFGDVVIAVENPSIGLFGARIAVATENEGMNLSSPEITGLMLNTEDSMLIGTNGYSPPAIISSSVNKDLSSQITQAVSEVAYNVILPISNLGVVLLSQGSAAIDLKELEAAGVQYTSTAELNGINFASLIRSNENQERV